VALLKPSLPLATRHQRSLHLSHGNRVVPPAHAVYAMQGGISSNSPGSVALVQAVRVALDATSQLTVICSLATCILAEAFIFGAGVPLSLVGLFALAFSGLPSIRWKKFDTTTGQPIKYLATRKIRVEPDGRVRLLYPRSKLRYQEPSPYLRNGRHGLLVLPVRLPNKTVRNKRIPARSLEPVQAPASVCPATPPHRTRHAKPKRRRRQGAAYRRDQRDRQIQGPRNMNWIDPLPLQVVRPSGGQPYLRIAQLAPMSGNWRLC
jgi:hypothetical protein